MTVDLSPVDELDIDQEILDFARENYCANCTYFQMREETGRPPGIPYCQYWEEKTEVRSGMICSEYVPKGYE